jgi:hypothetical protein
VGNGDRDGRYGDQDRGPKPADPNNKSPDWTTEYAPVKADVHSMLNYYTKMNEVGMLAMSWASQVLSPMSQMIRDGLQTTLHGGGAPMPEGTNVAYLMTQQQMDFQQFLMQVSQGLGTIGGAAAVIAEMYHGSDQVNSASLEDIQFVFADYGAAKPKNFPKGASTQTVQQEMAEQGANGHTLPMAAMGSDAGATVAHPANGVTIYFYPDGSSKTVTTSTTETGLGTQTVTETRITGTGAAVYQTTTQTVTNNRNTGTTTTATTQSIPGGGSTTTSVTGDAYGNQTVSTSHDDGKGHQTHTDPVTVSQGSHTTTDDPGPMERAKDQMTAKPDPQTADEYGMGY